MMMGYRRRPHAACRWRKLSSGPGRVDVAGGAPIAGRDLIDQHVGRRIRWPLFDADDHVVNPPDDLTRLIRREKAFGQINFGNRHGRLLPCALYLATVCLVLLGVKATPRPAAARRR